MSGLLTEAELAVLSAARAILQDIGKRAESTHDDASYRLIGYGRLTEACDVAGGSLFNVLNVANTYCDAELTQEQLHGWRQS